MSRFVVAVTHGWSGDEPLLSLSYQRHLSYAPCTVPLSAMVLDRAFNFECVKTYRSDAGGWPRASHRIVRDRLNVAAVEMAEQKARELNDKLA